MKRIITAFLSFVMVATTLTGCSAVSAQTQQTAQQVSPVSAQISETISEKTPKYIFMFIGDGMAAVQVNSAQIYGGTNEHNNISLDVMNFQKFEAVGYQTTHDATSFAPDSASTATSLSSGFKTWSGTLGLKPVGSKAGNKDENVDGKDFP